MYTLLVRAISSSRKEARLTVDRLPCEIASGSSERSFTAPINFDGHSFAITAVPGSRKFWKWSDYALCDANISVIVIKASKGDLGIPDLLELLFQAVGHGIERFVVIINLFGGETDEDLESTRKHIQADLVRTFGPIAETVPILTIDPLRPNDLQALFKVLLSLPPIIYDSDAPFQLSVNSVMQKDDAVIVEGKVRSGSVCRGGAVFLEPPGLRLKVDSMRSVDGQDILVASAGHSVALRIPGILKSHVSTGMMLVGSRCVGKPTRLVRVEVCMVNNKYPIRCGFSPVVSILSCQTLANITASDKDELLLGDTGTVTLSFQKTIFVRSNCIERMVFRQENVVIAIGVVREILDD